MSSSFCYHCGNQLTRKPGEGNGFVFIERRLFEPGKPVEEQNVVRLHVTTCARLFDEEQKENRVTARPRA